MYRNILIATDGTDLAGKALDHGLRLAKAVGAQVTIVNVTEPFPVVLSDDGFVPLPINEYETAVAEASDKILKAAKEAAAKVGIDAKTCQIKDQFPAEGIIKAAGDIGADLIVMASHGRRGFRKLLLGSQATEVLTHSKVPILICR